MEIGRALGLLSGSHHDDAKNFPRELVIHESYGCHPSTHEEGEGPSSQVLFLVELAAIAVSSPLD
jgi:hypothetical protein